MAPVSSPSTVSLLTNHGLVLLCIARLPGARLRDIAECVGITERATHRILCELEEAEFITRHRLGRRNYYEIHAEAALHHAVEAPYRVGDVIGELIERVDLTATQDHQPA